MTTVSVLIPSYNGARHIGQTIESVLRQSFVDYELIVVDDNSNDGTSVIVRSYTDPRIRLEKNDSNLGPEANWNRALGLAKGRYVKLLPQDDLLHDDSLARQVSVLEQDVYQQIALVFGARRIIGPDDRVISRRGLKRSLEGRVPAARLARQCVRSGTNIIGEPGAVMFRRTLSDVVGRFDGQQGYVIDLDYWLRLLAHGDGWYLSEPVSSFRVSGGSWSVAIGSKQSSQYIDFVSRMNKEGFLSSTRTDIALGRVTAKLNNVLRLVFYSVFVR